MVQGQPEIKEALTSFLAFSDGAMMVAHNATFDIDFIESKAIKYDLNMTYLGFIDTLMLSRFQYENELKSFNLKAVAKHFKIKQEAHHRAEDDARVDVDMVLLAAAHTKVRRPHLVRFFLGHRPARQPPQQAAHGAVGASYGP